MNFLLVHGFGCSPADWSAQIQSLGKFGDVVAVDLQDIAPDQSARTSLIIAMADRVNSVRRGAGALPTVFVGHSMGCRVVLEAARRLPEAVCGLVLIEGSLRAAGNASDAVDRYLSRSVVENNALLMRDFAGMFSAASPPALRHDVMQRAAEMDSNYAVRLMADMTFWDAADAPNALRAVQVPILVLQSTFKDAGGERRSIGPKETSPWLGLVSEQTEGRAQIVRLSGLGHFPHIEAPELVNQAIADFAAFT